MPPDPLAGDDDYPVSIESALARGVIIEAERDEQRSLHELVVRAQAQANGPGPSPDDEPETGYPDEPDTDEPAALIEIVATFRRYLHLPDPSPLYAVLACAIANRMEEGDPVWLIVVAGSSRGKTELVVAFVGLPEARLTGKLSEAALLSGTSRKERAANAKCGILKEVGERGLLVVKDLGAILAMHRESRAELLQALRDIYDGTYTRDVGVDGGKRLAWEGQLGLIGAATTALDSAHAVLSVLGERWLTVRLPEKGEREMVQLALRTKDTQAMRRTLVETVSEFIGSLPIPAMRDLASDEEELVIALSSLVCRARSPVERDPYTREIVLVHDSEGPARIARQLHKVIVALESMGLDAGEWRFVLTKIGLDSVPSPRREVLLHALRSGEQKTAQVATALDVPPRTAERALEELTAHHLLQRRKDGAADNAPYVWWASEAACELWNVLARSSPGMSENPLSYSPDSPLDDKTGEL